MNKEVKVSLSNKSTSLATSEYFIDKIDKKIYTSQREVSRLIGIPQSTISDWVRKDPVTFNTNEFNQLDAKSVLKLAKSGHAKGYEKCSEFIELTEEAGVVAYLYHQAGYTLDAKPKEDFNLPKNYLEALQALTKEVAEKEQLTLELQQSQELQVISEKLLLEAEDKIEEDKPKVEVYDDLLQSEEASKIGSVAKLLKIPPRYFFNLLREDGHLTKDNVPTARAINGGYMSSKVFVYQDSYGNKHNKLTPQITVKGLVFYRKKYFKTQESP